MLSLVGGLSHHSGGQSLEDKFEAFKCFISGQALYCAVLKATTSELLGPKKKHLTYLVTMTNEPNVSIPKLAKYLMLRASCPEWTVVFKALITIHHLMSYGNERFIQNLASSALNARTFQQLSQFDDRSSSRAYTMSVFVRRYSRYINAKIQTYRQLGLDFCQPSGLIGGPSKRCPLKMRSVPLDQLHDSILPPLGRQFDSLIEFDVNLKDLSSNGIISSAFAALYKDFVLLYIAYQSAIVRLLELYFQVSQVKRAQELLAAYRKFLVRMDKMGDFMRTLELVGMGKGDLPNVPRAPGLPLSSIEAHLSRLEQEASARRRQSVHLSPRAVAPVVAASTTVGGGSYNSIRRQRRRQQPSTAALPTTAAKATLADNGKAAGGNNNNNNNDNSNCDRLGDETAKDDNDGPDLIVMDPPMGPPEQQQTGGSQSRPAGWVELA